MGKELRIPSATIERIAFYSRPLEDLLVKGVRVISSDKFADMCKVNPAQIRKDLSYFGEFGVRGVGYDVRDLLTAIKKILVSDREWKLALVGLGNLGMALLRHENFLKRGYRFVAAFDVDPRRIGRRFARELVVHHVARLNEVSRELGVTIGVIATPSSQAQAVSDLLVSAGVKAILNFSPIHVRKPESCLVENVDFTVNLDNLAYHLTRTAAL